MSPIQIEKNYAKTVYLIAKTYSKLPSEIIKQSNDDWCLNMIITSIGRREEYRDELISYLKSVDVFVSDNYTVKRLESLLESTKKKNGK